MIYVHGDVELNKVNATIVNGGSATRIFSETHGTGSTSASGVAWNIANGASSSSASKWFGSIYGPFGSIKIGSGTGSSNLTGALWSGTQVNIQSGVTLNFAPSTNSLQYYPPDITGKNNNPIGSYLTSLSKNFGNVTDSAKTIFIIQSDSVWIEVIAKQGQFGALLSLLQTAPYGLTDIIDNGPGSMAITGKFKISKLTKLDSLPYLICLLSNSYCR